MDIERNMSVGIMNTARGITDKPALYDTIWAPYTAIRYIQSVSRKAGIHP